MVAVVSGSNLGLYNGTGLGGNGQVGRGRDQFYVNTTTGNLVIQGVDDTLSALGLDFAAIRTYNSQGQLNDDNGDNWSLGVHQRLSLITGAINTDGSTITKTFGDGAEVVYRYVVARGRYESNDGDGANDFLIHSGGTWTWTDGSSRATETYDSQLRIASSRDAESVPNTVTYTYTGSLLTRIDMAGSTAQSVHFDYPDTGAAANNLRAIRVVSNGVTQTLTRYTYDSSQRLQTVTVDLTPTNTADSVTYTTTYTYDGTTRRVASITQSDGSSVAFAYQDLNGKYRLSSVTDAEGRITTFAYSEVISSGGGTQSPATAVPGAPITNQDTQDVQHGLITSTLVRNSQEQQTLPYGIIPGQLTNPGGSGGTWATESTIDESAPSVAYPRLGFAADGNAVAAWMVGSTIYTRRFTASTNTWGSISQLDGGLGTLGVLKLAVDASGSAVVAWTRTLTGTELLSTAYMSSGGTWTQSPGFDSATVSGGTWEQNLAVAISGTRVAVSYIYNGASGEKRVELAQFNAGVHVRTDLIDAVTYDARFPSVAIDSNGNILAGWQEGNVGGGESATFNRWIAATQTFSGPFTLDTNGDGSRFIQVAYDAAGNAYSIWRQYGGIHFSRMSAATGTWSTPFPLQSNTNSNAAGFKLAVDAAGNAIVGWVQSDGTVLSAYARIYTAATNSWGAVASLESTNAEVTINHDVSVAISGSRAVAVWLQSNATQLDVYGARFENGAWTAAQLMESRAEAPSVPGSAIDASGNITISWLQADGSARSFYQKRFTAGSGGTPYYSVPAGASWQSIANTLYGVNSAAAGSALQALFPGGQSIAQGTQLTRPPLPETLNVTTTVTVPDYYLVPGSPSTPSWQSIAAVVYGIDSPAAGSALQTRMAQLFPGQYATLSVGMRIFGLPTSIQVPTAITLPYHYHVVQSTSWATTLQSIYGMYDLGLEQAVQGYSGITNLVVGTRLNVQPTQLYTVGGGSGTGSSIYQRTVVQHPLGAGYDTIYLKDTQGRLVSVQTPQVDGTRIETRYTYDPATGNVATISEDPNGLNRVTTFGYDAHGNLTSTRDSLGNTVTRTYNTNNQLETETSYLVRDPDGAGSGQPSSPLVSRYIYDGENHLRFAISVDGRVTEHVYNPNGERTTTYKYAANTYSGAYNEAALISWTTGTPNQRALALELIEYSYDFRGNLSTLTTYTTTSSSGAGTGPGSTTRFIYDQRGMLLSTIEARGEATSSPTTDYVTNYTYDGLGRRMVTTSWVSGSETARQIESITYDDAARRTVSTFAGGLTKTVTYNRSGDLTSVVLGPAALSTTTYTYDANGRLRVTVDPRNVRSYNFYDNAGRLIGSVDGDGSLTELIYNRASQVIKTVRYATALSAATQTSLAGGTWSSVAFATLRAEANPAGTQQQNQIARNVYDASGALVYTIDPLGAVTQNVYDGAGRLTDQIRFFNPQSIPASTDQVLPSAITIAANAADRRTRFFYNGDGQLLGTLDGYGFLKENVYDAAGRLVATIGYWSNSDTNRWLTGTLDSLRPGSAGSVAQLDPARDITTRFFYDSQGRKVGELDGERYLTEIVYDVAGNVLQSIRYDRVLTFTPGTSTFATLKAAATGATTHTTTYTYDGLGQVLTDTNFQGTETLFSYDIAGNLITTTRANGVSAEARTTRARYDVLGRLTQELSAEGSVALAALGGSPTQTQIDDVWARWGVAHTYDAEGRRTSTTVRPNDTQPAATTYFYYDNDGRLRFTLDPRGRVSENRYNALGQLVDSIEYWRTVSITTPTGGLLTPALVTQLTATESANVHERTTFGYSLRGEVTSSSTIGGATTSLGYNIFGELQSSNSGSGFHAYEYTYDARGLQKLTRRNGVTFEDRTYDAFGRLYTVVDARGNTSTTQYDRLGRAINLQQPGDANARITTYDAFSRVVFVHDKLLNTTSYVYDDSTRTVTVTTPESIVMTTTHNRHGDTLTVTAAGNTTTYVYDRNGQLTSASDSLGALEGRSYDRSGRQITATDALGTITTLAYDAANRLISRTVDSAAGGQPLVTTYAFDPNSRQLDVTEPGDRLTRTLYDRDGRVFAVIVDPNGTTPSRTEYVYDAANNVVTVTEGVGSAQPRRTRYVYDALGRRSEEIVDPTSLGGTLNLVTLYRYDNNDNVTRKIDAAGFSTWYTYDAQNRLVQTIDALGGVTGLSYDSEDRLVATRRHLNTVTTGGLGDTPAIQSVAHTPQDRVTRSVYDRDGRERFTVQTLSATGSSGNVTSEAVIVTERTFDANGNVTRSRIYRNPVSLPGTLTTGNVESALTAAGNSLTTPHADDRVEWTAYDLRGRAVFTVDGSGAVVRYTLDLSGHVVAQIEYATSIALTNLMTTASLTTWSDQASVANYPRNRVTRNWYDALGRARFTLDAEGYLVETKHLDATRQQQQVVYAGKPTIAAGATLANVVTAAAAAPSQSDNQVTTQTFDVAGRVVQVNDANNRNEYFVYDAVGNKIRYVNKKAASATDTAYTWTYEYDANGRLTHERSPAVAVTTITDAGATLTATTNNSVVLVTRNYYDALGNVTSRVEAEGTSQARTTSYEYDALGRQTATVTPTVGIYDATAGDGEWGANGASVARRETQDRVRSETAYDVFGNAYRNRLVTLGAASNAANGAYTYKAYDNLGRVKYEVDARNQLTSYTYDAFGNKTEVTRHAAVLSSALSTTSASISLADVESRRVVTAASDRTIQTTFDRLNRARTIRQPSADHFLSNVGSAGGTAATLQPTVEHTYDAFGQVVMSRELIASGSWATSYFYYDRRGNKTAELDAQRYLTQYVYDDSTGDLTRVIEYALPTTGAADVDTFGTIVASANGSSSGDDRRTDLTYDKLNRKLTETKVNLESSSISGSTLSTTFTGAQTTTYGYDVLGNQTLVRVQNPADNSNVDTYTYYDVLGRAIAIAQPRRDRGDGTFITPFTRMLRDAHGNLVQQIEYYDSLASAPVEGTLPNAPSGNSGLNRVSTTLHDARNNVLRQEDATGADRLASYNTRGDLAKEWQVVVNPHISAATTDDFTDTIVTLYRYDAIGQQTQIVESQRYDGANSVNVTRIAEYNAFGEITAKYNQGASAAERTYYHYDKLGRVWRTNADDGVDKVLLYDLQGNATVELRSRTVDLGNPAYTSAAAVVSGVAAANLMRTETAYDLKGNIIERRMPTFETSNGLPAVGTNLQLTAIGGIAYINWTGTRSATVNETFEYRPAGSTGNWTAVNVEQIAAGLVGANVHSLHNMSLEYRIRYSRGTAENIFAESTGTFRVDRATNTNYAISPTPPVTTHEIGELGIQTSGPSMIYGTYDGTSGWNGFAWQGTNRIQLNLHGVSALPVKVVVNYLQRYYLNDQQTRNAPAYEEFHSSTQNLNFIDWSDGSGEWGGLFNGGFSVQVYQQGAGGVYDLLIASTTAQPGPPMLIWQAATDPAVTATFRYKRQGESNWSSVQAERFGTSFRVPVQNLLTANDTYNYEVEYVQGGNVISRRGGNMNSSGVTTTRTITGASPGDAPLAGIFNENVAAPTMEGTNFVWSPPTQAVVATFEYSLNGTTYPPLAITTNGNWRVNVGGVTRGVTYNYTITYKQGNRVVAQQTGTFNVTTVPQSTTTSMTHTAGSSTPSVGDIGTLAGQSNVASASGYADGSMSWSSGLGVWWQGPNRIGSSSWASVGNQLVKVDILYRQLDQQGNPTSWIGGSHSFVDIVAPTGLVGQAQREWYEPQPRTGQYGGVDIWSSVRFTVWGKDAAGNYTVKLRETNATGSGATPRLTWADRPEYAGLTGVLSYSGANGSGTLNVTASGGVASVDLGALQGTFNFAVTYTRPGETAAVVTRSGGQFTTNGITSTVGSQGAPSNNNTAALGVNSAGSTLSWTRAAAGNTVTFRYRLVGSSDWLYDRQWTSSDNVQYSVNLHGLTTSNYQYEVIYRSGNMPTAAFAQGTLNVTTTTQQQTDVLAISNNPPASWPTQRIQPISMLSNSDLLSWSYAKLNASDTITFSYYSGGTWHSAPIEGTGPSYSARMAAVQILLNQAQSVPWELTYTRAGETNPYAKAAGSATLTVNGAQNNPVITNLTQAPIYPSGVLELAAPTDLGGDWFGWSSLSPEAGATVTFTLNGVVTAMETIGSGRRINFAGLTAGQSYQYVLTFTRGGAPHPYARAMGTFVPTKSPGAITNTGFTIAPPRAENTFDVTPATMSMTVVWPPSAVYWLDTSQQGGPRLQYGPRPYADGGGYEEIAPPSPENPSGTWHRWDPPTYKYYPSLQAIVWPRTGGSENQATFTYWLQSDPSQTFTATIGAYNGLWAAYFLDANGNTITPANGNYGYRIDMRHSGGAIPYATQEGTFVRSGGSTTSITPSPITTPVVQTVAPTSTQSFDRWGNLLQSRDAGLNFTNYRYNARDQLVQTLEATDLMFRYSTTGPATEVIGRAEKTNHYDLLGRLIETQDGYDQANRVSYNAAGQVLSKRAADHQRYNATSTNVYDTFGNLIQTTDESGYKTRYKFDNAGRIVEIAREITHINDAGGFSNQSDETSTAGSTANLQRQFFVYDQQGRRVSETSGVDSEVMRYRYDHRGNISFRMTAQQAARGAVGTAYVYDDNGKLSTETDALGSVKSWTYDDFGRLTTHTELQNSNSGSGAGAANAVTVTYAFNEAGALTGETSTANPISGQARNIVYGYDVAGNLTSIEDSTVNRTTLYRYDAAGRRSRETVFVEGRMHQDVKIGYDGHNRVNSLDDPDYRQQIRFDANGNRSYVNSSYSNHLNQIVTDSLAYTYDEMNRVLTSTHYNNSVIQINRITSFTYNGRGDRLTAISPESSIWERRNTGGTITYVIAENTLFTPVAESYTYDGLGRLKTVTRDIDSVLRNPSGTPISRTTSPELIRSYTYDNANRVFTDTYSSFENNERIERATTHYYDLDGRASESQTRRGANLESVTRFGQATYSAGTWSIGYDVAGNLRGYDVAYHLPTNGSLQYTATYKSDFKLGESYLETSQSVRRSDNQSQVTYFNRQYDVNGALTTTSDSSDAARTRHHVNNQNGQALTVVNGNFNSTQLSNALDAALIRGTHAGGLNWAKAQHFFFAKDNMIGTFGQLKKNGIFEANFDVNYTPISDSYPASVPSTIVAQAGDTLRTIAAKVFGDPGLWYIIAEENGLTNPDEDLPDGMQLRIPNDVVSIANTSDSFKPYNPADAIGDTTPMMPDPPAPKGGCGIIGMIIMIIVLIVVTIFTAGAAAGLMGVVFSSGIAGSAAAGGIGIMASGMAVLGGAGGLAGLAAAAIGGAIGSAVSQGVGIAIGAQEKFDWKGVAIGAISAGVGAGMGQAAQAAAKAAEVGGKVTTLSRIGSTLNKIGTVGRAAVSSAATQGIAVATGLQSSFSWKSVAIAAISAPLSNAAGKFVAGKIDPLTRLNIDGYVPTLGAQVGKGLASGLAAVPVSVAFNGKLDVKSAAADLFGNVIGNVLVDWMSAAPVNRAASRLLRETTAVAASGSGTSANASFASLQNVHNPASLQRVSEPLAPTDAKSWFSYLKNYAGMQLHGETLHELAADVLVDDALYNRVVADLRENGYDSEFARYSGFHLNKDGTFPDLSLQKERLGFAAMVQQRGDIAIGIAERGLSWLGALDGAPAYAEIGDFERGFVSSLRTDTVEYFGNPTSPREGIRYEQWNAMYGAGLVDSNSYQQVVEHNLDKWAARADLAIAVFTLGRSLGKNARNLGDGAKALGRGLVQLSKEGISRVNRLFSGQLELAAGRIGIALGAKMAPGSLAHKTSRWAAYQLRRPSGGWSFQRWSKAYELNMTRASRAGEIAEAYRRRAGYSKGQHTIEVEMNGQAFERRLDGASPDELRGLEHKSGYAVASKENLFELARDVRLKEMGWEIEWVFSGKASSTLLKALEKAGINAVDEAGNALKSATRRGT